MIRCLGGGVVSHFLNRSLMSIVAITADIIAATAKFLYICRRVFFIINTIVLKLKSVLTMPPPMSLIILTIFTTTITTTTIIINNLIFYVY